jgi:hypothetical protein
MARIEGTNCQLCPASSNGPVFHFKSINKTKIYIYIFVCVCVCVCVCVANLIWKCWFIKHIVIIIKGEFYLSD